MINENYNALLNAPQTFCRGCEQDHNPSEFPTGSRYCSDFLELSGCTAEELNAIETVWGAES